MIRLFIADKRFDSLNVQPYALRAVANQLSPVLTDYPDNVSGCEANQALLVC